MITACKFAKGSTNPILNHIAIKDGDVIGSDLELTYRERLPFDFPEVCIPAAEFAQLYPSLSPGWNFRQQDDHITIVNQRSLYRLPTFPVTEYPLIEQEAGERSAQITVTSELKDAIRNALLCAAKEDIRFFLKGVYLQVRPEAVTVTATNGHQLFTSTVNTQVLDGHGRASAEAIGNIILTRRFAAELIKLQGTQLQLHFDDHRPAAILQGDGWSLHSKCIQSDYPDYTLALNKKNPLSLSLNAVQFAEALHRSAFASDEKFKMVHIKNTAEGVQLVVGTQQKRAEEWIDRSSDLPWEGYYNIQYLTDIINAIGAGDVQIFPSVDDNSGTALAAGDWLFLIMPLKL